MAQKNKSSLQSNINSKVIDNNTGQISALDVRENLIDITDSLLFNSDFQSITGSLTATSFTGSLLGTSSYATTASYALNAGNNIGVNKIIAGINITIVSQSGFPEGTGNIIISSSIQPVLLFPHTGSAQITGSLGVTGSISTSGSNGTINGLFFSRGDGNISTNISIGATTNFSSSATGTHNTAIGFYALRNNTTGTYNTAIGYSTLINNTTGINNTAIGLRALYNNTSGSNNTAIGHNALFYNTSGSNNIAFGQNAGCFLSGSSSNNITIGFEAGPSTLTEENDKLYIASGSGTPLIKGDFAAKTVDISGSLTATSFTGSLLDTVSNAVTASYVLNAISSSFATTASYTPSGVTKITAGANITVNSQSGFLPGTGNLIISSSIIPGVTTPGTPIGAIQFNSSNLFGGVSNNNLLYNNTNLLLATGSFKGSFNGLLTNTIGQLSSVDRRTISPQSITNGTIQFGFGSFDNDNLSPYSDFIQFRTYTDNTGGKENLVMFNKAAIGMRIFQQEWNQSNNFTEYKDIAFTDGTNTTGNWPINITGTAATVTTNATLTGDISSTGNTTSINPGVIVNDYISSSADITLTKLATGTLSSGIQVNSANIVNGTITNDDISSTAAIALTKLATGELPNTIQVAGDNIANFSITNIKIASNADISWDKFGSGFSTFPQGITVNSGNIIYNTIINNHISNNAQISLSKLATGLLPYVINPYPGQASVQVNSDNIVDNSIVNDDIYSNAGILDTKLSGTGNYQPATVNVVELTQITTIPTTGRHKIVIINPNNPIQQNQPRGVYLPQSPKLGDILEIIPGATPGPYPYSYFSTLRPSTYGTQQLIINNTSYPSGISYNLYFYYKFICTLQAGPEQPVSKWMLVEYSLGGF
jgi:hypothetical protein